MNIHMHTVAKKIVQRCGFQENDKDLFPIFKPTILFNTQFSYLS